MMMGPGLRKVALTAHVTASVGWLGLVVGFLALALAGLISQDKVLVQSVYPAMALITWWAIIPFSFASVATGLVSSLGSRWGLFRHYWVLAKIILTLPATVFLLFHAQPIDYLAQSDVFNPELRSLRVQVAVDAGLAIVVLLLTTGLAVLKPQGMTRYGRRMQRAPESP